MQNRKIENFYWIGGCSSGGKTTISSEIARDNTIPIYHIDHHFDFIKEMNVNFVKSVIMIPDESWFEIFLDGIRVQCSSILDSAIKLYADKKVIIESNALLPEYISKIGFDTQAVFVNPTYDYLCKFLPKQKWVIDFLLTISEEENKLLFIKKLLYKYNLFRKYIIESAEKYNIKTVTTVSPNSLSNNIKIVLQHFSRLTYK